jgi:hypothetical protein
MEYINRSQTHECGNWAAQFPEKEYINGIFVALCEGVTILPNNELIRFTIPD